ncbi:uncharacterized protein BJX67DRAFT_364349 [Aspergillus lucknowensis]|uniref:Uncharacterized protein n=1 Tax=Aspergillus lucknowensis TaxID=176173 RepID=A0ABR4LFH1_9EURO
MVKHRPSQAVTGLFLIVTVPSDRPRCNRAPGMQFHMLLPNQPEFSGSSHLIIGQWDLVIVIPCIPRFNLVESQQPPSASPNRRISKT